MKPPLKGVWGLMPEHRICERPCAAPRRVAAERKRQREDGRTKKRRRHAQRHGRQADGTPPGGRGKGRLPEDDGTSRAARRAAWRSVGRAAEARTHKNAGGSGEDPRDAGRRKITGLFIAARRALPRNPPQRPQRRTRESAAGATPHRGHGPRGAAVNGSGASARRRAAPSFGGPSSVVAPCGPRRRGTWTMARIWIFRARAAWSTLGSGRQRSARPCERPPKRAQASGAGAGAEQGGLSF